MKKCPVCGWEIKDKGVTVKSDGKDVVVCCAECAQKLKSAKKK